MPKINIIRKKIINAPIQKVHSILSDMSQWQTWSPWLISEPDAKVNVRADNKFYSWSGKRVGVGQMEIVNQTENNIDYDLTFLKPWKSKSKVSMSLNETPEGTEVSWKMDSSLPWFMFWMKRMMTAFISSDYDRGLNLLKDYAQEDQVYSKLNFIGEQYFEARNYISISRSCSIEEMPLFMKKDFTKLMTAAHNIEGFKPQDAFSVYHKWDMVKKQVRYTAGVPYEGVAPEVDFAHDIGTLPSTKVYTLEHIGPYEHVGNAWSTMIMMQRNKEFKSKKGAHPFETYGNSPKNTPAIELKTRIHFPIID